MIEDLFAPEVVAVSATGGMWDAPLLPGEAAVIACAEPKRRREYAAGRACTREALDMLGIRNYSLLNDSGGVPIWPEGVVGSLSHCEHYCGVAVAWKGRIRSLGFDAESASYLPTEIRSLVCSEIEMAWIERQHSPPHSDWYKLFFCAKESAFKAIFPILRQPFDFWELQIEPKPQTNEFAVDLPWALDADIGRPRGRLVTSEKHILAGVTILQDGSG